MNRIISGRWNSKTDIGGSLFEMSTSYNLLCRNKLKYLDDKERRSRFYEPRSIDYSTKDHRYVFNVWKKSLSLRYLIESLIFFAALLIFQIEISAFNSNLQITIIEVVMYQTLQDEIVSRGYDTYYARSLAGTYVEPETTPEVRDKIKERGNEMMNTARETGDRSPEVFDLSGL